ncbi:MAG: heavy metal translocating P-type ATPase [Candidatus Velthaea sp.]
MTITAIPSKAALETELAISGMTCASCAAHVTNALEHLAGVSSANVNLATEHATIRHTAETSSSDLIAAVVSAGYQANEIAPDAGQASDDADARRRDDEITRKRRLLVFAIVLFAPTAVLAMLVPQFAGKDWVLLALTVPVWAVVGWDFHRGAIARARHKSANMDTLVSLGSTAALGLSIYATIAGRPSYYETASAIVTLIFIGKYLEAVAKGKSNRAIRALLDLRPVSARIVATDGTVREVSVERVRPGDVVQVPAGEGIPIDGIVVEGRSSVNVAMLTGEPLPLEVQAGHAVQTGTVNGDGMLLVRATAVGTGTVLAKIVEIVRKAQGSTPPVQRLADRVAGVFVPAILVIATLTFAAWILTGHPWPVALVIAVAVLVVACPCALGLATPTAIMVAIGVGAQRSLLFKDAGALERLGKIDTVVFDKTGTLTIGHLDVIAVRPSADVDADALLGFAAAVESSSSHPLAAAIVRAAGERNLPPARASESIAERGRGVRANVKGRETFVGTRAFLEANGIERATIDALGPAQRADATLAYVARDGVLLGAIELADRMRVEAGEAVQRLRALKIDIRLVSGDVPSAVSALASGLGITEYVAQASPEQKADIVKSLRERGHHVAFVGDGINDAPALASADVGLAMGGGTEIAMETAQAAIISNDPRAVATAIHLSRATMRTIVQNLFWAFAYNAVLVPLAALGLVQPMMAAAAMGISSLFVVGNSLLLRHRR